MDTTRLAGAAATAKASFANPAWAKAHGYGFDAKAFSASQKVPATSGGGSLDAKTDAALNGSGPGKTFVPANGMVDDGSRSGAVTPHLGQLTYPDTGCQAEANQRLYGDLKQLYTLGYYSTVVSNLRYKATSAPAVSASLLKWRGCMVSHGWASFQSQPDPFGKVYAAYSARQPNARKLELSIAPVDAGCTVSSGYGAAFRASEEKVAGNARKTMSGTITPLLEMQRKAVAAAEVADAGKRVVILDQEPEVSLGGQAFWSLGGLFMVDTPEQRLMGVRDSLDLALQDWFGSGQRGDDITKGGSPVSGGTALCLSLLLARER